MTKERQCKTCNGQVAVKDWKKGYRDCRECNLKNYRAKKRLGKEQAKRATNSINETARQCMTCEKQQVSQIDWDGGEFTCKLCRRKAGKLAHHKKKAKKRKKRVLHQCLGVTKAGIQCKVMMRDEGGFCRVHRKQVRQSVSPARSQRELTVFLSEAIHYAPKEERFKTKKGKLYNKYLTSSHWEIVKSMVRRLWGTCRMCGGKKSLHVHHITYVNMWQETWRDVTLVCEKCHNGHHKGI